MTNARAGGAGWGSGGGGEPPHDPDQMRATNLSFKRARNLRRDLSPPEARLWARLKQRQDGGPIFRRQHPIGPFILDFYCARARLAVEIDGEGQGMGDRPQRDASRDAWLKTHGIAVLRIPASEVFENADEAGYNIWRTAEGRLARGG